jgi:uncharacterized protein GlcG (DUF336 family)
MIRAHLPRRARLHHRADKEDRMQRTWFIRACAVAAVVAACWFVSADMTAQDGAAATLDKVTLSGDAANRAFTRTEINLETAERIVNACRDFAKARNGSASIFVIAPSGEIVHALRMDGQGPVNIEAAYKKAKTALFMRASTHETANRYNSLDAKLSRASLDLFMQPGGFPIIVQNQIIGAIGVGGYALEEECAYAALTKVLGPQPPMAPNIPFGGIGGRQGGAAPASGQGQGRGQGAGRQ